MKKGGCMHACMNFLLPVHNACTCMPLSMRPVCKPSLHVLVGTWYGYTRFKHSVSGIKQPCLTLNYSTHLNIWLPQSSICIKHCLHLHCLTTSLSGHVLGVCASMATREPSLEQKLTSLPVILCDANNCSFWPACLGFVYSVGIKPLGDALPNEVATCLCK